MAKSTFAPPKPLRSRGYDKIVLLTLVAIGIGCALIGWEIFVEYEGKMEATKTPAVKIEPLPPADTTPPAPPPPGPGPGPAPFPPPPGGQ